MAQIDKRRRKQYGFIDPPGKNSGNSRRGRKTTSPRANPSYSKKRRNVSNKSKPKVTKKKKKKEETESEEEADLIESEHEENELQKGLYHFQSKLVRLCLLEMEAELKKHEEAEEVDDEDADFDAELNELTEKSAIVSRIYV